jgi:putative membrane protein
VNHAAHAAPTWTLAVGVAIVLLGGYGVAGWTLRRRTARTWRPARGVAFTCGVAALAVGLSPLADPGVTAARAHMVQHVLLGMAAPVGLVLGAPVTLGLSALPVAARSRGTAVLRSRPVRTASHPLAAGLLHVGGLYLLYLTPLYARTLVDPAVHALVLVHFLAAGCLFAWSLVGPERTARRPGMAWRVGVLVGASAAHGYLAKLLYARAPQLPPGSGADIAELQDAARWMYAAGDVAEVALAVALFAAWYRRTGRTVRVVRAHADRGSLDTDTDTDTVTDAAPAPAP